MKHDHCSHENLKHCPRCDVTYCLGCQREWGANSTYQPYTITTVTDPTWTTTTATDLTTDTVYNAHSHA